MIYKDCPALANIGDRILFAAIANESQWAGTVIQRTFSYHEDGLTVFFDLAKKA